MLQPFSRLFPGEGGDADERTEEEMSGFKILLKHNTKVYEQPSTLESDKRTLVVWTLGSCVKKLREARTTDPWLGGAADKAAEFEEKYKNSESKMEQLWAADCIKVWKKAYDYVMNEPAPEAPPEPADFGEPEDPGDQSPPQETPKPKTSLFRRSN